MIFHFIIYYAKKQQRFHDLIQVFWKSFIPHHPFHTAGKDALIIDKTNTRMV